MNFNSLRIPTHFKSKSSFRKVKKGQSLIELLVAVAIGTILIGGSVTLMGVSLKSYGTIRKHLQSNVLIRQTAEVVQSLARSNWHSIADLTPGIHYKIAKRGNTYTFQKGEEKVFDDTNLVAYWNMDEGSGQTAYDNKNTNNGTLINSPTWKSGSDCISSSCLEFNGSNQYMDFSNASVVDANTGSIEAWVNASNWDNTRMTVFSSEVGPAWVNLRFVLFSNYNNSLTFSVANGTNSIQDAVNTGTILDPNQWYHIVGTYNGSEVKIFVNGIEKDSYSTSIVPGTFTPTKTMIGWHYSDRYFNGSIDEVRIYDTALTVEQIGEHYKAGLDKLGLVGYWSMDENGDTTVYDNANSNNGTFTNSPTWKSGSDCVNGSCLNFTGTQYVNCGTEAILNMGTSNFTLDMWFKIDSASAGVLIEKRGTGLLGYLLTVNYPASGNIAIFLNHDSSHQDVYTFSLANVVSNNWYHVAVTIDRSNNMAKLYHNGIYIQTVNTSGTIGSIDSDGAFRIGHDLGGALWHGFIDEVRIYNRALSEQEINNRYQAGYTRYITFNKVSRTSGNIDTIYNSNDNDPSTLKTISTVKCGEGLVSEQSGGILSVANYLTRSENNKAIHQADWSGASGVSGPTSNLGSTYDSTSNILLDYDNQLINPNLDDIIGDYHPGWDESLNGTYRPNSGWGSGYNGGVSEPSIGYHAYINTNTGINNTPCFEYIDENCQYGYCHRWLGISQNLGIPESKGWGSENKIVVSLYGKVDTLNKPVRFGLYYYDTSDTRTFHSGLPTIYFDQTNTWEKKEYTFSLINNIDITKDMHLYIYGHHGEEGRLWIDNVGVKNGPQIVLENTASDGWLESSIIDTGVSSGAGFNSLLWQGSLGTGGAVKFQIAFSNSSAGPWTYYGPTSISDWYQPNPDVSISLATTESASPQNKRYIRYKVNLSTTSISPKVDDIIINWSP